MLAVLANRAAAIDADVAFVHSAVAVVLAVVDANRVDAVLEVDAAAIARLGTVIVSLAPQGCAIASRKLERIVSALAVSVAISKRHARRPIGNVGSSRCTEKSARAALVAEDRCRTQSAGFTGVAFTDLVATGRHALAEEASAERLEEADISIATVGVNVASRDAEPFDWPTRSQGIVVTVNVLARIGAQRGLAARGCRARASDLSRIAGFADRGIDKDGGIDGCGIDKVGGIDVDSVEVIAAIAAWNEDGGQNEASGEDL